jgi:hypothetical protein
MKSKKLSTDSVATTKDNRSQQQGPSASAPRIEFVSTYPDGRSSPGISAMDYLSRRATLADADEVVLSQGHQFRLMLVCSTAVGHTFDIKGVRPDQTRQDLVACSIRICLHDRVKQDLAQRCGSPDYLHRLRIMSVEPWDDLLAVEIAFDPEHTATRVTHFGPETLQ